MSIFSPLPENALPGDHARRRGTLYLLIALLTTPLTVWLFINLYPLWSNIAPLEGIVFMLTATLFGGILAVAPIVSVAGWLLALWYGVESVFMPRGKRTPTADILITGIGLVAWFLPTLGFLASTILALVSGQVHFARPTRDYLLAENPTAYWQGIGYQLIGAAIFAWLAWRYWRSKLRRKPDM